VIPIKFRKKKMYNQKYMDLANNHAEKFNLPIAVEDKIISDIAAQKK
jgi:hypothetical protein